MAPAIPFVATGWLADPLADAVGPATVALVLHLAARASAEAAGGQVTIPAAVWNGYIDADATARLASAGLIDVLPAEAGGIAGVVVGGWLLGYVDTEGAINRRVNTRERVRRLRARRAESAPGQLALWITERPAKGESTPMLETKDLAAKLGLCITCERSADVTSDVTLLAGAAIYPRADARPKVRTKYISAASGTQAAKIKKQPKSDRAISDSIGAEAPAAFRLLLALVARTRRARWQWRYPTTATDRRGLLEAVRTDMARAHLPAPMDREIKRAIRIDECNDLAFKAAAGMIGGGR